MFAVEHRLGTVAGLHGVDPFEQPHTDRPRLWWCDPSDAAVALGSRQTESVLDLDACRDAGLAVARRRSGGGAVLVIPGQTTWIDLVLPHGVAPDDVRGAMVWAGGLWRAALVGLHAELADRLVVRTGGMQTTEWSELVCFAGLGPGEVVLDGHKLVGLSQRRTRLGIRIQGMLYRDRPGHDLSRLFAVPIPAGPMPRPAWLDVAPDALLVALSAALAR